MWRSLPFVKQNVSLTVGMVSFVLRLDCLSTMRRSARLLSFLFSVGYLLLAVLITTAASFRGMCGDGDFRRPPCAGFAFGIALYGALALGAVTTGISFGALILRRRFPRLLNLSSILYVLALAFIVIPVTAAGNKFAGAIVVLIVFPFSLLLLSAALICFLLWIGHAAHRDPS